MIDLVRLLPRRLRESLALGCARVACRCLILEFMLMPPASADVPDPEAVVLLPPSTFQPSPLEQSIANVGFLYGVQAGFNPGRPLRRC